MYKNIFSLACTFIFIACAANEQKPEAATSPASPPTLKNLKSIEAPKALEADFNSRSAGDGGIVLKETNIFFASSWKAPLKEDASMEERYDSRPSIVIGKNGEWKQLELNSFERYGWESPVYVTDKGEVWAFLDYTVEGRMAAVPVIYSADFGQTWEVRSSIGKPKFTFALQSLQMDAKGEGFATFKDSDDEVAYAVTKDRGLTWTLGKRLKIKNILRSGKRSKLCLSEKHPQPQTCPKN